MARQVQLAVEVVVGWNGVLSLCFPLQPWPAAERWKGKWPAGRVAKEKWHPLGRGGLKLYFQWIVVTQNHLH